MKYLILGAGLSGRSLAQYLKDQKKTFYFYDDRLSPKNQVSLESTDFKEFLSYEMSQDFILKENATLLLSPGVPSSHPLIVFARKEKVKILSELDFSLSKLKTPIIAVTGTNGKSTVVSMIYHILKSLQYKTALLGNIGIPISSILGKAEVYDFLVLEVSSYQLEQLQENPFYRSVFLNFAEDHIERHGSLRNYFLAKYKIFETNNKKNQGFCPQSVLEQAKDFGLNTNHLQSPLKIFKSKNFASFVPQKLHSPKHNLENASIALEVCASFLVDLELSKIGQTLDTFKTIPHRFETFATRQGVVFIDDSKATNMHATLSALDSLEEKTLILLGGLSKGESFQQITSFKQKLTKIVSFGKASATIKKELGAEIPVVSYSSLREALDHLFQQLDEDKSLRCVLLSPACSSFDEFQNFSDRGAYFQARIKSLLAEEEKENGDQRKL